MDWELRVYRDCDTWALRKNVVEVWKNGKLVDRSRLFRAVFKSRWVKKLSAHISRAQSRAIVAVSLTLPKA